MRKKARKKLKLKEKLTNKYRLVILNEGTFKEYFSLKLSILNVFALGGFFCISLIFITVLLITLTPLKEYIHSDLSIELKRKSARLTYKTDSLKNKLAFLESYTKAIKPILNGEIKSEIIDTISVETRNKFIKESKLIASKEDSLFREKLESNTLFSLQNNLNTNVKIVFFSPLSGVISQGFNPTSKHFAIDIVAKVKSPIKAIADGTVIFSGWTIDTGYTIILKHTNDFISVYKHNGSLLKEQGDFVKSGEVVASVGSSGELTTGPHLHFELWKGSYAVNPTNFIDLR